MMVFAQVASFRIDSWILLWSNLVPICSFTLICFLCSSKIQLTFAKVLSIAYAFVMMAVLVGTGIQITTEGVGSPTSVFVLALSGVFFAAAFLHPRELHNIFYGAVFFLMIPCTYVVMALYSLINLHVINWGTREAAEKAVGGQTTEPKYKIWLRKLRLYPSYPSSLSLCKQENSNNDESVWRIWSHKRRTFDSDSLRKLCEQIQAIDRKLDRIEDRVDNLKSRRLMSLRSTVLSDHHQTSIDESDQTESSIASVSQTVESPKDAATTNKRSAPEIKIIEATPLSNRLGGTSKGGSSGRKSAYSSPSIGGTQPLKEMRPIDPRKYDTKLGQKQLFHQNLMSEEFDDGGSETSMDSFSDTSHFSGRRKGIHRQKWMDMPPFAGGQCEELEDTESQFWIDFLENYLKPIKRSSEEEKNILAGLRSLRNNIALGLLLVNGLLILIIYLLQLNKELLSIKWSVTGTSAMEMRCRTGLANYTIIKWDSDTRKYEQVQEPLKVEPIGFTIILFLSLILIVQTSGMLLHRWQTIQHVLASTVLTCFEKGRTSRLHTSAVLQENAVEIAKVLQKLHDYEHTDMDFGHKYKNKGHNIVLKLEKTLRQTKKPKKLHAAFKTRFLNFTLDKHKRLKGKQKLRGMDDKITRKLLGIHFGQNIHITNRKAAQIAAEEALRLCRSEMMKDADAERASVIGSSPLDPADDIDRAASKLLHRTSAFYEHNRTPKSAISQPCPETSFTPAYLNEFEEDMKEPIQSTV
ncbi:unnamed protein product [Soboliphyme baturini]|uniref:Chitin synthase n=1 Tax=Soboliphyme baturini TaxID=241478 RepID=A0A183IN64_9BILA|nr:unnamed protein product [Soboliphyme baturini]